MVVFGEKWDNSWSYLGKSGIIHGRIWGKWDAKWSYLGEKWGTEWSYLGKNGKLMFGGLASYR